MRVFILTMFWLMLFGFIGRLLAMAATDNYPRIVKNGIGMDVASCFEYFLIIAWAAWLLWG